MSDLPDLTEHEAIVYTYLLHHKANAHEIERSFEEGIASGAWHGVAALQHENHVSRYLKSLEGKGLIKAIPHSEIKEELLRQNPQPAKRKRGRPKEGAPPKSRPAAWWNLGRYYTADPNFIIGLLAPSAHITEEEARAFLQSIEKFSRPQAEVVKTLGAISKPSIITALGYIRLLAEELRHYILPAVLINITQEGAAREEKLAISYEQRLGATFVKGEHAEIARRCSAYVIDYQGKQQAVVSAWKYLSPSKGEEVMGAGGMTPELANSINRFCGVYAHFHDTELMWRLQEQRGLSRPAPPPSLT